MKKTQMDKKFLIHYAIGSGGFFIISVFAQMMGIKVSPVINPNFGHVHNLGQGDWVEFGDIYCGHDMKPGTTALIMNAYDPLCKLYQSHIISNEFANQHPDIKVVKIDAGVDDYEIITKLAVKKAFANRWTKEEYDKWASPDYPPYSPANILESELVCNDIVKDFLVTQTTPWFDQTSTSFMQQTKFTNYAHIIDFKTVMGIKPGLAEQVAEITGGKITDQIRNHIKSYQDLNKKLYFN